MKITDEMVGAAMLAYMKETAAEDFQVSGWLEPALRAALTAALAVQPQQWVEVKPLEWEYMCLNGVKAAGGMYALHDMDGNGKRIRAMFLGDDTYRWFVSIEHAKAAAQSDYEFRIRSALVDVPAVESEPVAWQWRSRIKGGAWDSWENGRGRHGQDIPPFMDVEERPLYAHPPRSLSNEGEIEAVLKELADYLDGHHFASERANATQLVSKARAALSTRKGPAGESAPERPTRGGQVEKLEGGVPRATPTGLTD